MAKQILLLILLLSLGACNAFSQAPNVLSADARRLCNRVAEIKDLPMKGDPGVDATYDALVAAGETVVPCLIEKIADTSRMRDPRCFFSEKTTVGDVAFFVLTDITKLDFVELLPTDIQEKYKTQGAYAYHDYIRRKGARRQLQSKVREWYRRKHSS
jgi:hypothetical protein